MLIVYRIIHNIKCRMLVPSNIEDTDTLTQLACQSVKDSWETILMYDPSPLMEKTNFYQAHQNYIIADEVAFSAVGGYFQQVGEVLPIECSEVHCPNSDLKLVNILECHNCLDHAKTVWEIQDKLIQTPVFNPSRVPTHISMFKLPETRSTALYTVVDTDLPDYAAFKSEVKRHDLKGLVFNEIWRSEN